MRLAFGGGAPSSVGVASAPSKLRAGVSRSVARQVQRGSGLSVRNHLVSLSLSRNGAGETARKKQCNLPWPEGLLTLDEDDAFRVGPTLSVPSKSSSPPSAMSRNQACSHHGMGADNTLPREVSGTKSCASLVELWLPSQQIEIFGFSGLWASLNKSQKHKNQICSPQHLQN